MDHVGNGQTRYESLKPGFQLNAIGVRSTNANRPPKAGCGTFSGRDGYAEGASGRIALSASALSELLQERERSRRRHNEESLK